MPFSHERTAKGDKGAVRLVDAATVVLARDGFGGATVAAITQAAGYPKRMVSYYFGSREALLAQVVVGIGERLTTRLESTFTPLLANPAIETPAVVERMFDEIWAAFTEEPEAVRAYFALISGQWEGEAPNALRELKRNFFALCDRMFSPREVDSVVRLGFALLRGLALEWIEDPGSPAFPATLATARRMLVDEFR